MIIDKARRGILYTVASTSIVIFYGYSLEMCRRRVKRL